MERIYSIPALPNNFFTVVLTSLLAAITVKDES